MSVADARPGLVSNAALAEDETVILPKIPGYRLHSILGAGGFATVYLATQSSLDRRVALKVMNPAYALDRDLCERFIREGQDLAIVSEHVNIVTVFDVGNHEKYYYIAMQYLPGPTLKQLISSREPYQHPLYIIKRIAEALSYAHRKGYVHRDIKPANILFNAQGEAVLSDFGIAKTQARDNQLTQVGQLVGTELYMSPEQALRSQNLDLRSDIYSLGVVFYETLTRSLPYRSTQTSSVTAQHVNAPIPTLPESESIYQPLIDRMMSKNPNHRYASTDDLLDDIQRRFFSQTPQPPETEGSSFKSNLWQGVCIAVLCLVIVGVVASFFYSTPDKKSVADTLSAKQQITITESLELAELNELMGRVDSPPGSNAIELYELVLSIDPDNVQALESLNRLRQR